MQRRLTAHGVAELLGLALGTVHSYKSRGSMPGADDCPTCGYTPTWDRSDVVEWDRNRLGVGRPRHRPGTSKQEED